MTAQWKSRLHSQLYRAELLRNGKLKGELRGLFTDFEIHQFTCCTNLKTVIHFCVRIRLLQASVVHCETPPTGDIQDFPG